ncbi:MAG: O-antigen ligase family protein, partial [Candidatus Beckwithbacteria bacterium]
MLNLFYLLLFLLPTNLAKHFPIPASYVNGYLVDYLIPAIYLTDILIILLLIFKPLKKIPRSIIIFSACLLPSVIFANSFWPAAYKFLKLFELSLFGLWLYQYKTKIKPKLVIVALSAAVLFQSSLAIGQWLNQGSLFGYWFSGEQPYNSASSGIDKITWFDGSLKLPPLGTFTHPNVLAGFLVIIFTLTASFWLKKSKLLFVIYSVLTVIPLFLTFSLSAWLAFLLITVPYLLLLIFPKIKAVIISLGLIIIVLSLSLRFSFLAPESSFSRRSQLAAISVKMISKRPLTGVGLN